MLKSRRGSQLGNEKPARRRYPWKSGLELEALEDRWMFALAGDANLDAAFGSADLIAAFQAGKFEMDAEATWAEGDWNGDQRFNTSDLIAAFTLGRYEMDAPYPGQYDVLREKYVSINEGRDALGGFIGEGAIEKGSGLYAQFEGGAIYWSSTTGAHVVQGAIWNRFSAMGWEQSVLGYPISDEMVTSDGVGRYNAFQGSLIVWSAETGAHEVYGEILEKWGSLGWERSFLAYPVTDQSVAPDGIGQFSHFQGGSVYWSPDTGAHEVHGAIRDRWSALGWAQSVLGYPTSDETVTSDGVGRYNAFQGGLIIWSAETGANEVHGAILDKWGSLGWERSFLGYPLTNESIAADGVGRFNHFQGGSIYWSPTTGAHEVHGAILAKWSSVGWEQSWLGYPVSDEHDGLVPSERVSDFQFGKIVWNPTAGASIIESNECPGCIVLNQVATTPGITALGGWVEATLRPDGHIRFKGHMHDSGL